MKDPRPTRGVAIKKGAKRKRSARPSPTGKEKNIEENELESEESTEEESPKPSTLKRMKCTAAKLVQEMLFDEPELEPEPSLSPSPAHSSS